MVPILIERRILTLAIAGDVDLLDDCGAGRFGALEMRIDIRHENRQRLRGEAALRGCGIAWFQSVQHDMSVVQVDLRAGDGVAIAVMFAESESGAEPCDGRRHVLNRHVRQQNVGGNGSIAHRLSILRLGFTSPREGARPHLS